MKIQINPKDIDFTVTCLEEETLVHDHLEDQEADAVLEELGAGNPWAWCIIKVEGHYVYNEKSYWATDFLGACSYASHKDFIENSGHYECMCQSVADDLSARISEIESRRLAVEACRALVAAYNRGEENSGSVEWEDVDDAHALAAKALE